MTTANGTTYNCKTIKVKSTTWTVLFVTGKLNYVSIRKESANPFKTLGKEFPNIDAAIDNYKSMAMKAALMQIA